MSFLTSEFQSDEIENPDDDDDDANQKKSPFNWKY